MGKTTSLGFPLSLIATRSHLSHKPINLISIMKSIMLKLLLNLFCSFAIINLSHANTSYCTPENTTAVISEILIDGHASPYVLEKKPDYQLQVTLQGEIPANPYFLKVWIDTDENSEFQESEEIITVGPLSEQVISHTFMLPEQLNSNQSYNMRVALSDNPHSGSCDPGIFDFWDDPIYVDDPFTVSMDDSSCPCNYDPDQDMGPGNFFCYELGQSFSGRIRIRVPETLLTSNMQDPYLSVEAFDPLNKKILPNSTRSDSTLIYPIEFPNDSTLSFARMIPSTAEAIVNVHFDFPINLYDVTQPYYALKFELHVLSDGAIYQAKPTQKAAPDPDLELYDIIVETIEIQVPVCATSMARPEGEIFENKISKVHVYPNPSSDFVYVPLELAEDVALIDTEGNQLQVNQQKSEESIALDLRGISQGAYFLILNSPKRKHVVRVIKR